MKYENTNALCTQTRHRGFPHLEKHREKVREHRRKLAELKQQEEVESRHPRTDEEELWRRLDELELQEELQHEMDLYY